MDWHGSAYWTVNENVYAEAGKEGGGRTPATEA